MNIIVLMKQVPDTEAPVEIDESGKELSTDDIKWAINPYDEYALEEALLIKESRDDVTVTVVSVGPDRLSDAIRVAYAMGVDAAIHINDTMDTDEPAAIDPCTTARLISSLLKETRFDLIIAGNRAVDDDSYQVPAHVSRMLGIPMITLVVKQSINGSAITCDQAIDGGTATVEADLPVLITAQKGLNEPRYPAFRAIMKAKKKSVDERGPADLGFEQGELGTAGAKLRIRSLDYPPERGGGRIVNGSTPVQKAEELVRLLKEEACVI